MRERTIANKRIGITRDTHLLREMQRAKSLELATVCRVPGSRVRAESRAVAPSAMKMAKPQKIMWQLLLCS